MNDYFASRIADNNLENQEDGGQYDELQQVLTFDIDPYDLESGTLSELYEERGFVGAADITVDNGLSEEDALDALGSWYVRD